MVCGTGLSRCAYVVHNAAASGRIPSQCCGHLTGMLCASRAHGAPGFQGVPAFVGVKQIPDKYRQKHWLRPIIT